MHVRTFTVACDICGGEGLGDARTAAAEWNANARVTHRNPEDCRYELARRAEADRIKARSLTETVELARSEAKRHLDKIVADAIQDVNRRFGK